MTQKNQSKYLVFSYHFASDSPFVYWLSRKLSENHIPNWFLDDITNPATISSLLIDKPDPFYEDWRKESRNWQAVWLDHILEAAGVILIISEEGEKSIGEVGRGMWREKDAIEFIKNDNPIRVRIVKNPECLTEQLAYNSLPLEEIIIWAKQVLSLPPVHREKFDVAIREEESVNPPYLVWSRGISPPNVWYDVVRLDLYDIEWRCRRCGLKSGNFCMHKEAIPESCPRCHFKGISI